MTTREAILVLLIFGTPVVVAAIIFVWVGLQLRKAWLHEQDADHPAPDEEADGE